MLVTRSCLHIASLGNTQHSAQVTAGCIFKGYHINWYSVIGNSEQFLHLNSFHCKEFVPKRNCLPPKLAPILLLFMTDERAITQVVSPLII
jgi:hypothetical protein